MTDKESTGFDGQITQTLKKRILGELHSDVFSAKKREVHVMTRLSSEIVEVIDTLVELEVFRSRSEAVSAYVEKGIASQVDLYEDVKEFGRRLSEMRETAKRMAFEAFQEKDK
ncbi:MAG: hypothetical protein PVG65_06735 [Candidatus Thorarchaeota archaeon]|jgi:Arc/MetJ-type ribon-helix-helix transcriptional regulator